MRTTPTFAGAEAFVAKYLPYLYAGKKGMPTGKKYGALFDLDASNDVFLEQGVEAYRQYQIEHEDEPLAPGEALLWRDAAMLHTHLGNLRAAVVALEHVMELSSDPALSHEAARLMQQVRSKLN